jgi:hypothetical protein
VRAAVSLARGMRLLASSRKSGRVNFIRPCATGGAGLAQRQRACLSVAHRVEPTRWVRLCVQDTCVFRTGVCVFRTRAKRSGMCSGRGCVLGTRVGEQACSCAGPRFGREKTEAPRVRTGYAFVRRRLLARVERVDHLGAEHVDDDRHDRRVPRAERERAPGAAL